MFVKQLDLVNDVNYLPMTVTSSVPPIAILNGFYYERSTNSFVSFVQGRRFYEEPARGCRLLREWQAKIKRERGIP